MPPETSRFLRVSVAMPVEQRIAAQALADRRYVSLSVVIREAVQEKLAREREPREVQANAR